MLPVSSWGLVGTGFLKWVKPQVGKKQKTHRCYNTTWKTVIEHIFFFTLFLINVILSWEMSVITPTVSIRDTRGDWVIKKLTQNQSQRNFQHTLPRSFMNIDFLSDIKTVARNFSLVNSTWYRVKKTSFIAIKPTKQSDRPTGSKYTVHLVFIITPWCYQCVMLCNNYNILLWIAS